MFVISDLEDRLNAILSDPEAMGQITILADALQREKTQETDAATPPQSAPQQHKTQPETAQESTSSEFSFSSFFGSGVDANALSFMGKLFQPENKENETEALLRALRPFLNEPQKAVIDQMLQLLKFLQLAQAAIILLKGGDLLV